MKKHLALLSIGILGLFCISPLSAQNFSLTRSILSTGTIVEDSISFEVSSDDAEQENDEMDSLFDDDLDAGWEGAPEDQNRLSTGLRFRDIYLPKGATIDSAFLILTSHEAKNAEDIARITIVGEATDHALTFDEQNLISDRPRTNASLLWEVNTPWELWGTYKTPDLKNILQEIINRNGWNSGNSLALFLLGENQGVTEVENAREFESFENISDPEDGGDGQNHPERRPQLLVYFSVNNAYLEIPVALTDTITEDGVTFEASSDDAEQENDEMDSLFDDDLDAGWEGAPEDQNTLTTGIRFRGIGIPKGAVVDSAFIVVVSHEAKTAEDIARITITAEATDNAQTFTENALITDRPRTSAATIWEVSEPWELWGTYRTPNLKNVVQEVVNRSGWTIGNAIAFILQGENQGLSDFENAREFESFENISDPEDGGDGQNHPERRPKLVVYYTSGTSSVFTPTDAAALALKLYPNPTNTALVTLELANTAPADIKVFDLQGRFIMAQYTEGTAQVSLNTTRLQPGVFVVQAIQNGRLYRQTLVKSN